MSQFVDEVTLRVASGKGGDGSASFRREKFVPRGGPDGGDGGNGGSILLLGTPDRSTLLDFKHRPRVVATPGENGRGKKQHGKSGEDLVLKLPLGTQVYDADTGLLLADIVSEGQVFVAAQGGRGGRGNVHFTTSTRQSPDFAEPGKPAEELQLRLELKVLAKVGLLGFPNAGKSTFLGRVTRAHPRIGSYPFTTLHPHLGVVSRGIFPNNREYVVADLPGLIEGAHEGKGLGDRFLRHVERTQVLLHFIDVSYEGPTDPEESYRVIRNELALYDPRLLEKPEQVAATKIDSADPERVETFLRFCERTGRTPYLLSSQTGEGIPEILNALDTLLDEEAISAAGETGQQGF
ncbi:MAG: GTPase ObgE [Leptospirillia bacterium]